jgi:excisionase family DNA binding protein
MNDDILDVDQAAKLLRLTAPTVRQMASRNLLPGRRLGKLWRFSRKKLIEFIEAGNPCLSTNAETPRTTGVDSLSVAAAFSNRQERPTGRKPKNTSTGFKVVPGGKSD